MKTLSQFLSLISEAQKVNIGRLDPKHHELWKTTGHKSLLDDLGSGATSEVTKKSQKIDLASRHHHTFEDGSPHLKYYDRHDPGYNGSVYVTDIVLPQGSRVVRSSDGDNYSHHRKYGHISWRTPTQED